MNNINEIVKNVSDVETLQYVIIILSIILGAISSLLVLYWKLSQPKIQEIYEFMSTIKDKIPELVKKIKIIESQILNLENKSPEMIRKIDDLVDSVAGLNAIFNSATMQEFLNMNNKLVEIKTILEVKRNYNKEFKNLSEDEEE